MLASGKYGVEWNDHPIDRSSGGIGWIVLIVVVIAVISLGWTLVSRMMTREDSVVVQASEQKEAERRNKAKANEARSAEIKAKSNAVEAPPAPKTMTSNVGKRPTRAAVLMEKLEEVQKRHDIELEVATIEQIRSLPGSPMADRDDAFARRLGSLNMIRLFKAKHALWVKQVTVISGQSASRIAAENGSTLASFAKLNGGKVDKLKVGQKMWVLDHPRFQLVVHRRLKMADLTLNGKFFNRFDLIKEPSVGEGAYEITLPIRDFWARNGIEFKVADRQTLELLLPKGAPVLVSEL